MAVWAYICHTCGEEPQRHYVSGTSLEAMPPGQILLKIRIDGQWHCARLEGGGPTEVEGMLVRDAIPAADGDCPECEAQQTLDQLLNSPMENRSGAEPHESEAQDGTQQPGMSYPGATEENTEENTEGNTEGNTGGSTAEITAAAVTVRGIPMMVVLAQLRVVLSEGDAAMLASELETRLGSSVVLMGQEDDGTPVYFGDGVLKALLADIPIDRLPWKVYALG